MTAAHKSECRLAGRQVAKQSTDAGTVSPAYYLSNAPEKIASLDSARREKFATTLIAKLALAGHHVHRGKCSDYVVCKYGMSFYAEDVDALQAFAKRLAVFTREVRHEL